MLEEGVCLHQGSRSWRLECVELQTPQSPHSTLGQGLQDRASHGHISFVGRAVQLCVQGPGVI